jgi:hypothetical protein
MTTCGAGKCQTKRGRIFEVTEFLTTFPFRGGIVFTDLFHDDRLVHPPPELK